VPAKPTVVYIAGMTRPIYEVTIRRKGKTVDLTPYVGAGKSIKARVDRGTDTIEKTLVADADQVVNKGLARLTWAAADLVVPTGKDEQIYYLEFVLDEGGGAVETSPDLERILVRNPLPAGGPA
jgi:hypothetical protein